MRREINGQIVPTHVWVRVGPMLWQVRDCQAADRLTYVWSSCARLLTGSTPRPSRSPAHARSPRAPPVDPHARRGVPSPARPPSRIAAISNNPQLLDQVGAMVDGARSRVGL